MIRAWAEKRAERRTARLLRLHVEWKFQMAKDGVDITDAAAIRESLVKFIIENGVTKHEALAMLKLGETK